ncbi:putative serine/threonine protein kinase [Mycena indigotica]|uniref:Putative serine/threonine protein kinase n=1 Tax=Mycena indigotica TaxID=2126181 RepID=A0A8H6SAK5_9AGAR|nr:putative serine/threonine protein kinase [Mycena indigotica]KAF7294807.1 putative serine/threonine protein kinase [Mycena indigotica]
MSSSFKFSRDDVLAEIMSSIIDGLKIVQPLITAYTQLQASNKEAQRKFEQATIESMEKSLELTKAQTKVEMLQNNVNELLIESRDHISMLQDGPMKSRSTIAMEESGSRTRARLWDDLSRDNRVQSGSLNFSPPSNKAEDLATAKQLLDTVLGQSWPDEVSMYLSLNKILEALTPEGTFVHDTHSFQKLPVDSTISWKGDLAITLFHILTIVEWKSLDTEIISSHKGQMVDYLLAVKAKVPAHTQLHGVLSNLTTSFVFEMTFAQGNYDVRVLRTDNLLHALMYAIDNTFTSAIVVRSTEIFASTMGNFIATVQLRDIPASLHPRVTKLFPRATKVVMKTSARPSHTSQQQSFLNEVEMTKRVCCLDRFVNVVQYLKDESPVLFMFPHGRPIGDKELPLTMRNIVQGVVDGLKYIHDCNIIHRDLRRSNVVLVKQQGHYQPMIIDFGCAVDADKKQILYEGSALAYPPRILSINSPTLYDPTKGDDLFALILMVQTLLFPLSFSGFDVRKVEPSLERSRETQRLLDLWTALKSSSYWGQFYHAADRQDYNSLKEMSQPFVTLAP